MKVGHLLTPFLIGFPLWVSAQTAQWAPPVALRTIQANPGVYVDLTLPFTPFDATLADVFTGQEAAGTIVEQWNALTQSWTTAEYVDVTGWDTNPAVSRGTALKWKAPVGGSELHVVGTITTNTLDLVIQPGLTTFSLPTPEIVPLDEIPFIAAGAIGGIDSDHSDKISDLSGELAWLLDDSINPLSWQETTPGSLNLPWSNLLWMNHQGLSSYTVQITPDLPYNHDQLPAVSTASYDPQNEEMLLDITTPNVPSPSVEIYYQDVGEAAGWTPDQGWSRAEVLTGLLPQTTYQWTDVGTVDRLHPDQTAMRVYLVADGLLDADSDGLSDTYEYLVAGTNPSSADTDGDGIDDSWEDANQLNPLLSGLTGLGAYYQLDDEPGGTAIPDASGNPNDATLQGKTTDTTWGPILGAEHFDGVDDGIELSPGSSSGLYHDAKTAMTVAFWVNPETLTPSQVLFECGGTADGLALKLESSSLRFGISSSSVRHELSHALTQTNQWMHVAAVYDAGTMNLYLNGVQVASRTDASTSIGAHTNGAGWGKRISEDAFNTSGTGASFQGRLDEGRVFLSALSQADIQSMHELGADPDGDGVSTYHEYLRSTDPHNSASTASWSYVSPSGNDTWTGWTSTAQGRRHGPLLTLSAGITQAIASSDSLQIEAGTYSHSTVTPPASTTLTVRPVGTVTIQL